MTPETAAALARGDAPKGDVLGTARLAGIGAAKRTDELIPLAHPLPLDFVDVEGRVEVDAGLVLISAEAGTTARTGVEMEAMTACAVAALTVYDMVKGLERGVAIEAVELVSKSGGRSGEWRRDELSFPAAVITVSTSRARGEAEDTGGPALAAYAERLGAEVVGKEVIADDRELIAERLRFWCDEGGCALVLTTGGTGFSTDDVTPEATRDVIEREAPGLPEAMRAASREHTADVDDLARRGRDPRAIADRQLPRQPARDRAGRGGARAGDPARGLAADGRARAPASLSSIRDRLRPTQTPTLYEWAGGEEAIRRLIDAFYDRVERDELISPVLPRRRARGAPRPRHRLVGRGLRRARPATAPSSAATSRWSPTTATSGSRPRRATASPRCSASPPTTRGSPTIPSSARRWSPTWSGGAGSRSHNSQPGAEVPPAGADAALGLGRGAAVRPRQLMRSGRYSFPYITYDPPSDVLYARITQGARRLARSAPRRATCGPTTPTGARPG